MNREIIKAGKQIVDTINEAKRFERQYQEDKKRNDFQYQQIMQMRRKYEETKNNNRK
jgi:phage shock protein A